MAQPVKVFYCYASADEDALLKLEKWLKPLELSKKILPWHRRKILPGANLMQEVEANLDQAEVIILLVSSDFLDSGYSYGNEMERALQREHEQKACVIPVILSHCLWLETPLRVLQPLPADGTPISAALKEDAAWQKVAMGIVDRVNHMQALARQAVEPAEATPNGTKPAGKARQPARTRRAAKTARAPIADASMTIQSPAKSRKPRVSAPPQRAPIEYKPRVEEEPEPATPKARQATPDYDQSYDSLQNKINNVRLKILVWEPEIPTQGIVAEKRRAIFHALQAEQHQCRLGKTLPVPANASLQEAEIEEARQSDTAILLCEPLAQGAMTEFCRDEDVVEKTLIFYPSELQTKSDYASLDKIIHIRFHLDYYQDEDMLDDRILTQVLNWVMAHRSFRYSNSAQRSGR